MDERPTYLGRPNSKVDAFVSVLTLVITGLATYYALNPESFERTTGKIFSYFQEKIRFRESVKEAEEEIDSLPSTDITDITPSSE